jgi:hypothetical protein
MAVVGCTKAIPSDADHQNELKLAPVVGRGGGSDDSIKPKPVVGRGGGSDDGIKPKPAVTPVTRAGTNDDSVRPVRPPAQGPAALPATR